MRILVRSGTALALAVAAGALAGCGGGGGSAGTSSAPAARVSTSAPADPGAAAVRAFVAAARQRRPAAMWSLLSSSSRQRLGPSIADFRRHGASGLSKGVGAFARFSTIVSERITDEFGVVAIDGTRAVGGSRTPGVYAAALRLEGARWKIELAGPVTVRPIGPDPGAHENVVAQVAAAVEGPGGAGTAVMYVDGLAVDPQVRGTATNSTLFYDFDRALDPGRHTVVVFATDGREAAATAWAFTVRKPRNS